MDWIAVGALAELVGAVAVVVTLLYLAEQARNNTRMARRAATAEAVAAIREANARIPDDLSVSQLFWKGLQGLENLSEDERGQLGIITFNLFKACEHLHYQWVVGAMDPDVWTGWEWNVGNQQNWDTFVKERSRGNGSVAGTPGTGGCSVCVGLRSELSPPFS